MFFVILIHLYSDCPNSQISYFLCCPVDPSQSPTVHLFYTDGFLFCLCLYS